ncbi:hypothetical protein ACFL21_04470 [Patescibacteria group bacterium]
MHPRNISESGMIPGIEKFSNGDKFRSNDFTTTLTILSLNPGGRSIGLHVEPPSVWFELEKRNPDYLEDFMSVAGINMIRDRVRDQIGLCEHPEPVTAERTIKTDQTVSVEEFLDIIKDFKKMEA